MNRTGSWSPGGFLLVSSTNAERNKTGPNDRNVNISCTCAYHRLQLEDMDGKLPQFIREYLKCYQINSIAKKNKRKGE
jgi:hypothetical protein